METKLNTVKSPLNKSNYDEAKRSTNYHVRQAKYEYERSIATNMKKDNKIFWKFIQSKTKSKENIPCIMDENGEVQMNNKIKVELLNKFFQSVLTTEDTTQGIPIFPSRTDQKLETIEFDIQKVQEH
jgi:membrane-associated HD superfamily phosphohydrolase